MRVALFFDGKNFYSGLRTSGLGPQRIDFVGLADWLVAQAGGNRLWGAYYYTGVETGPEAETDKQRGLQNFLKALELKPGFFVHRFDRKKDSNTCDHCGKTVQFTREKEVDTTMVADMLRLAAVDAFDAMVLVSGDADLTPAVEGVRGLGKQAFVATWGTAGLSTRIRRAAYAHVDLLEWVRIAPEEGCSPVVGGGGGQPSLAPVAASSPPPALESRIGGTAAPNPTPNGEPGRDQAADVMLTEIRRAEAKFGPGRYVGASYFVTKWQSGVLESDVAVRQRVLAALVREGRVEIYEAPDGSKAIRVK